MESSVVAANVEHVHRGRPDRPGDAEWGEILARTPLRHARLQSHDGTELDVQHIGDRGPLIVLVNGLGGSIRAWPSLVKSLAPAHRLVSWDYRGLYRSGRPADPGAVRVEDHCEDLGVVIEQVGGGPAVLVGWSMGVQVSVQYTLDHPDPVAGLVLVCGAPGDPFAGIFGTASSRHWVPALCRLVEAGPRPFGALVRGLAAFPATPALLRRSGMVAGSCDVALLRVLARDLAGLDWRLYARSIRAMGCHDAWDRLGEIRVPVLAVGGTHDMITPASVASAIAAGVCDGEAFIIEGATHYVPLEFPDELNDRIERFLSASVDAGWRQARTEARSTPRSVARSTPTSKARSRAKPEVRPRAGRRTGTTAPNG